MTSAELLDWLRGNRRYIDPIVVALAIASTGSAVRVKADHRRVEIRPTIDTVRLSTARINSWRTGFVPPSREEREVWARLDSLSKTLGIPSNGRMILMQRIYEVGEERGLSDFRISVGKPDTTITAPPRPEMATGTLKLADYTIEIAFAGRFADAVRFVTTLPDAVFPAKMSVFQDSTTGASRYRITLLVFQLEPRGNAG